jgi:hypothetical protein
VRDEIDRIIIDALLLGAAAALDEVADELGSLRSAWAALAGQLRQPRCLITVDEPQHRYGPLHGGGPLPCSVFFQERPTPTSRQVPGGGPPPHFSKTPDNPRRLVFIGLKTNAFRETRV